MKTASKLVMSLTTTLALIVIVQADDKKIGKDTEVILKGTITCAKCDLKEVDKCATVVKVKENGKDIVYYFDKDSDKKYHADICQKAKEGQVTGIKGEMDNKKTIKVSKVKYTK